MYIWLRLKLIADAGLVGLPNAGKSTFLAAVSAAKPKIADYPFTTLHPNLGVVRIDTTDFVLADIPGLIEGAHEGAGLGDRFLGHVERTAILLHLIDATQDDPAEAYQIIRGEIEAYGAGLEDKPEIVALSKADAVPEKEMAKKAKAVAKVAGAKPLVLSAVSGQGMQDALRADRQRGGALQNARVKSPSAKSPGGGHETGMVEGEADCRQDRLVASGR